MNSDSRDLDLAKILAAAAWADGTITADESAAIEEIASDLGLTDPEREELRAVLNQPVGVEEAEKIARDLLSRRSPEEQAAWLQRIERVISNDRQRHPLETELLRTVRNAIGHGADPHSLIGRVRGLFRRERGETQPPPDPERRQYATLFGSLLSRVAFADGTFTEDEAARLQMILTGLFDFEDDEAGRIVEAVRSKPSEDLDRQRLCAAFNRVSDMKERMRLLGCLFALAEADDQICEEELRELRLISNYLWLGPREFHQVRQEHH